MPLQQCLVCEILRDGRLPDTVWADEDCVRLLVEEGELKEVVDQLPINLLGPAPVEVRHRLETADLGCANSALKASLIPRALLISEELG